MIAHTQGKLLPGIPSDAVVVAFEPGDERMDATAEYYGGRLIAESLRQADRNRVIACWNACEDIPTEVLEQPGGIASHLAGQAFIRNLNVHNGLNMELEGSAARILAESFAGQFKGSGATNYLEVGFTHPETGQVLVTIQRVEGKTPAQMRRDAEAQRDAALKALTEIAKITGDAGFKIGGPIAYSDAAQDPEAAKALLLSAETYLQQISKIACGAIGAKV